MLDGPSNQNLLEAASPTIEQEVAEIIRGLPKGVLDRESQWYETPVGRKRMAFEVAESCRNEIEYSAIVLPDHRLTFRFVVSDDEHEIRYVGVICQSNHPTSYPDVFIEMRSGTVITRYDSCTSADVLRRVVERCRAIDRYDRAVHCCPTAVVQYALDFPTQARSRTHSVEISTSQWYSTDAGKNRLADEVAALANARLSFESKLTPSGDLAFLFAGSAFYYPELVSVMFPSNYPHRTVSILAGNRCIQQSCDVDTAVPPYIADAPILVEALARAVGTSW